MEDVDEFGDLYTDVLRPLQQSAAGKAPPTPPIDPNIDSDDEEILYGASDSTTAKLNPNLNPAEKGGDSSGFEARVLEKGADIDDDDDDINIIVEEREDKEGDLMENDPNLTNNDVEMYATAVQGGDAMNLLNDAGEIGSQQMIPGLLSGGVQNPGATNIEDGWDSEESDDDLQIVLNDTHHGPMGMERMPGVIDEDDEDGEPLVIAADNGDPHHQAPRTVDEQEWGGEEGGSGVDREKDLGDTTKASGGGGAASAAAQPKVAYSNHAYHHPFSSQFKYVRPGAAPFPPAAPGGIPGQVRPPINMGPPAGRGRGDWRPAGMKGALPQKGFHPPAWGVNSAGRGYGSGLDFTLPSHKTIFEVDIDSFEEKPWKLPGVDVSDFFNFGLNEDSWREYCKQLEQLRLEMTMQSKIRVYESGRAEQDYDPDLPPELAAAVGIQDNTSSLKASHGKVDDGPNDLARAAARERPSLPVGRPIPVETGSGDRLPSIDTRRPRMHDIDAIIEIACQSPMDGDDTSEQLDSGDTTRKDHVRGGDEADSLQQDDADHMESYSPAFTDNKREFASRRPQPKNTVNNDGIAKEDVSHLPSENSHSDQENIVLREERDNDASVVDDRSFNMEREEMASDASERGKREDGISNSTKKQKLSLPVGQPPHEYDDGKDSKAARSNDSKIRSGSSEHHHSSDDVDDDALQDNIRREVGDEDYAHRKDHYDRDEAGRQSMVGKGREDSFSRRGGDANSSLHLHAKAGRADWRKGSDISEGTWNRRDEDHRGRRTRLEDQRKRDHGREISSRDRDKLREKDKTEKDEHHLPRNRLDNGSWRGTNHELDSIGSRERDRDDHLKGRSERVGDHDLHSTRRKEESHVRQTNAEKDDNSQNHRSSVRRKRDRDDGSDMLKRDEQGRSKDDEVPFARQKEGVSSQRERNERPRERAEWHRTKQDDLLSKREREETRPVTRSGRAAEDKTWPSHSRGNDDYKVSSRDYHPKDVGRHSDQLKQRDRIENDNFSQRRSHDDVYARGNQLSIDEKRTRYDKTSNWDDRAAYGSDTSRAHEYKRKEASRKSRESDSGDQSSLIPSKRNQDEDGGRINEKANLRGRTEQQSGHGPANHQSSRKQKEEASTDEEQPDSKRGRSKLERWTSHKERDFGIAPTASSLKKRDRDTHTSSVAREDPPGKIEDKPQPPAVDNQEAGPEMNKAGTVEDKHLDTVAKLKKRSERFKLPLPVDKDAVAVKEMESGPEIRADSEIKSERPARKRRWTSN
ncbi:hypothetical protein SASPL_129808 [Salvia splendens]|uniref:Pre-mRNA polyadenylation factor Fip1 domain-containing protein n=1 Tax=Salvia splendens TaxID=180675 RepID=A0A8X8XF47_SALSN|nr:hypothetical protein SASPL_129808 [Salvia splendens]